MYDRLHSFVRDNSLGRALRRTGKRRIPEEFKDRSTPWSTLSVSFHNLTQCVTPVNDRLEHTFLDKVFKEHKIFRALRGITTVVTTKCKTA
ncbi:MAG: hypothetical protein WD824_19155 [Cyclobacteriaceae bacterium]